MYLVEYLHSLPPPIPSSALLDEIEIAFGRYMDPPLATKQGQPAAAANGRRGIWDVGGCVWRFGMCVKSKRQATLGGSDDNAGMLVRRGCKLTVQAKSATESVLEGSGSRGAGERLGIDRWGGGGWGA
jgi:hypothetical protein